jgi:hypothetical protein
VGEEEKKRTEKKMVLLSYISVPVITSEGRLYDYIRVPLDNMEIKLPPPVLSSVAQKLKKSMKL